MQFGIRLVKPSMPILLFLGNVSIISSIMYRLGPYGLSFLRLVPTLNATVILMFAYDEYAFLSCWTNPAYRPEANALLPRWFKTWLSPSFGLGVIFTCFPLAFGSSLANIFISDGLHGAAVYYWLGFAFQLAHFAYAKPILGLLRDIPGDVPKGNVVESMKRWLRIHWVRTLTTDLPAWVFFVMAKIVSEGHSL